MNAGAQLDELVAEKVMGWMRDRVAGSLSDEQAFFPPHGVLRWNAPPYSTDIAAAWQVVEKLRSYTDEYRPTPSFRLDYDESYGVDNRSGWSVHVAGICEVQFAATAPHAICLAALKVVGVE